jgi:hypothetical protein
VSHELCQKQLSDFFPPGDNNQPDNKKNLQQSAQQSEFLQQSAQQVEFNLQYNNETKKGFRTATKFWINFLKKIT